MIKRVAFVFALAITLPLDAGQPLVIRLTPAVALEPAQLTIRASIEADSDNRALEIVAESPDFYRSSEIPLDGESAPRLNVFEFKNLPTGTYHVTGVLVGSRGHRAVGSRIFQVETAGGSTR